MHSRPTAGPSPRVVLVDDDAETLVLLQAALEGEGVQVVGTAGDGSEVEALVEKTEPDVVLMDLRMPGMNGLDLLRHLAATGSRIPAIILTAHGDDVAREQSLQAGAVAFLRKPFDGPALLDAVATALRRQLA